MYYCRRRSRLFDLQKNNKTAKASNEKRKTKAPKNKDNDLTNAFFCDIITEREILTDLRSFNLNMHDLHHGGYLAYGEDTHALRLTSELVDFRAGYAKWS